MPNPTYDVDIAWDGTLTSPTWTATETEVQKVRCSRGRQSDMAMVSQGTASLVLRDNTGKYNPENSGSALDGKLLPMRPVRIQATYAAVTYGVHYGYISSIRHDPGAHLSYIDTVDLFEWLALVKPTIAAQTNKSPDYLIGLILDAANWTDVAFRSLEASTDTVPSWSADGTRSAISLIEELLSIERGLFFIDGAGIATYLTRATHYANGSVSATLDGDYIMGLQTSVEKDRIINAQAVERFGGTAQSASDATSQTAYGIRDGNPIRSPYLESDSKALSLANFLVGMNKNPRSPVQGIRLVNGDANRLTQMLAREIGDMVTISESRGGTSFNGRIQGISHDFDNSGKHETIFTVQKVSVTAFTIGVSTIGGSDVISY